MSASSESWTVIQPQSPVPGLSLPLVGGDTWTLHATPPTDLTFVSIYRGYCCPICKNDLRSIDQKLDGLAGLGIDTVAVSSDTRERAEQS